MDFIKSVGTVCEVKNQYGTFDSVEDAKVACLNDSECVGFLAVQPNCTVDVESRNVALCKRNSKFTSNIPTIREYRQAALNDNKPCFYDSYIKSNESGIEILTDFRIDLSNN